MCPGDAEAETEAEAERSLPSSHRQHKLVRKPRTSSGRGRRDRRQHQQCRENLFPLVREVNENHTVVEIVARNGGNAVLMSAEDYESLRETLYLFSTRANAAHILRGLAEAREGTAQPTDVEALANRFGPETAGG